MARPVKKMPEQWKKEILEAAQKLFISKGYEETSISDIMEVVGGAKGMFYRCFQSKEEVMHTLGNQMFFRNNSFEKVKKHTDINRLQKIRELLIINQSDTERNQINIQAISILKDPHILAAAVEENKRILTPLWFELLEEGKKDGSTQTDYAKELSDKETSHNPIDIIDKLMSQPFCHMHGSEHHVMVGSALLTAYKNAGGDLALSAALTEMVNRGKSVPGGACGFWGACGAGISSGMFISIISKSTPLANEPFALSHQMTS